MDNAEFRFGFKVAGPQPGEQPVEQAGSDEDEDVYHSGQEDQDDEVEAAETDDRFFAEPEPDFWAPYDPSQVMPSEELRAGPSRAAGEAQLEQEEIEVAPGLFMLKARAWGSCLSAGRTGEFTQARTQLGRDGAILPCLRMRGRRAASPARRRPT